MECNCINRDTISGECLHKKGCEIPALTAERDRLREALEKIVNDTEDEFPPYRSLGTSGPVMNIARKALGELEEEDGMDTSK